MTQTSSISVKRLAARRGDYGFDAPYVPAIFLLIGLVLLVIGLLFLLLWQVLVPGIICLIYAAYMLLTGFNYIYTTRCGKFQVWAELLAGLHLRGDEQVLDLGCGRGAVLLMVAGLLPEGKATGVDIWRAVDQSGNASEVTQRNADLEGVAGRIELRTADMRELPFADNSFDLVLSSVAIHNIPQRAGRDQALAEAARVLKPGGRLIIADIQETQRYTERLRGLGLTDVSRRMLGWRFSYGFPWVITRLVTATKPA